MTSPSDFYHLLFDNLLNGIAHCQIEYKDGNPVDFIYLNVNKAFVAQTGLSDVVGKRGSEAIPEIWESSKDLLERYARVAKTGVPETFEYYLQVLKMWLHISVYSPQKDQFVAIFDVITQRKENEVQLSNALKIAHLGTWIYDVQKDLFTFNDPFYAMFHTSVDDVGGYTLTSQQYAKRFVHPEDMKLVAEEIQKALETKDANYSAQLEHRILYADGTTGFISVRFVIVKDSEGNTVRTYGVNQDITARIESEHLLQVKTEELQKKVKELELINTLTIDRELKMVELKKEIEELKAKM